MNGVYTPRDNNQVCDPVIDFESSVDAIISKGPGTSLSVTGNVTNIVLESLCDKGIITSVENS